jgi:nitroimidazol reductase NimA-like FMN-containing flavoprotein (pyridoxamine 5'-phosphate oxidase superfamily)
MASVGSDGYPYITPVNYVYFKGSIYFHCARAGEKLDNISRDPRVCFEVDIPLAYLDLDYYGESPEACKVHQFYHCVIVRGRAEVVAQIEEKIAALNALVASHESAGRDFIAITEQTEALGLCEVVAVRIERISAKSDLAQNKSDADLKSLRSYLSSRGLPGDSEAAALLGGPKV